MRVAILTAGGLAPCLSAALADLIDTYTKTNPEFELLCYLDGYKGLLMGNSVEVGPELREKAKVFYAHGGSPIGNSRVKLTNQQDCEKRGLVEAGIPPLEACAQQLRKDRIDILHTIGGDDTNTTAACLAAYLATQQYQLRVVGLPKTVDNDVFPITQSLGAYTAAEQGARFFSHVVNEFSANPRMLIIHEVMGRHCGWLTAATAQEYRKQLATEPFAPGLQHSHRHKDIHGVYIPEMHFDLAGEAKRLKEVMDELGCVNIFLSEGAGLETIVKEMEARGEEIPRDAFGHVKLDRVNPGQWFGKQFALMLNAEKVLVQKSGYYARSAPSNQADRKLIRVCAELAVESAVKGESGVVGHDEDHNNKLRCIEFPRIKGGKPFSLETKWFKILLAEIEQPFKTN
ncbi:MAG: pyrophosphate--fructose-6-phosphate 1-phosphotransferase [Myxococcota bacterium]|nr:pyrophosphate--fructose-6-phosphate 1-phosphotransferase [Myxococcota bacterium]